MRRGRRRLRIRGRQCVARARSWKHQIDLAPILLRRRAFTRPVGSVVIEVGYVRRPEACEVTVEQVALDRLTKAGGRASAVGFPTRREHEGATEWHMGTCLLRWPLRLLQRDDIVLRL